LGQDSKEETHIPQGLTLRLPFLPNIVSPIFQEKGWRTFISSQNSWPRYDNWDY
jgi:hypothetical protein